MAFQRSSSQFRRSSSNASTISASIFVTSNPDATYDAGFYPVFTDTYKKADQGHEECSCQSAGSSLPSSSVARLSRPAS
ncbi:hypothetical protein C7T86_16780, partial [Xanthomonas citri pv. malvacearum]